jgi:hypothetical protein
MKKLLFVIFCINILSSCTDYYYYDVDEYIIINGNTNDSTSTTKTKGQGTISFGVTDVESGN